MQTGTAFAEPRWTILFPESYDETVRVLIRDWVMIGSTMVLGIVLGAWINSFAHFA
jgi:hypothetical protein